MANFLISSLILSCFVSVISCKAQLDDDFTYKQRLEMIPAKNADEWLNRLKNDLAVSSFNDSFISRLYSELPPQDQWSDITAKLDEITKDSDTFKEFTKSDNRQLFHHHDDSRLKIQFFSSLLSENNNDAEPLYRALLLQQKNTGSSFYRSDEIYSKLLLLSKNREESIAWFEKHIQKEQNIHNHSSSSKPEWKKALAGNRIDEGIQLLLKKIKSSKEDKKGELISSLARIAHLLKKPKLGEQAMAMLENNIIANKKTQNYFRIHEYRRGLDYLAHHGEWQRLYDLCVKVENTKSTNKRNHSFGYPLSSSLDQYQLTALYNLKKHDEFEKQINALIKKNSSNPKSIFRMLKSNVADSPSVGALYIDLLSLKDNDSKKLAFKICIHLLARAQGKDGYYRRAITLNPEAATLFIDSLRKFDPFEERPLIWQAEMALQAGQIEKADKLIQQAIALDPSDGDQGKFTRMHCYDVLARILAKQGNTEKSKFFSEVVISIREGEAADDYLHAGLIQEATDRYKRALGHFNDAYCLQSRLAKTLMEAGKFDEAIPHFKKAFELMPVSFGPRESHCFGCEGLFDDVRVQNIAFPILSAFLEEEPTNPRTPYLLGLLFEEMKKKPEAITAYQKAIELDPRYYNAAKNLYDLISADPNNFEQTIALKTQLLEIAPYHKKASYLTNPHLLKSYWKRAQAFPPSPLDLAPLADLGISMPKLSGKQFEEIKHRSRRFSISSSYFDREDSVDGWSAREILQKNSFLNNL